MGELEKAVKTLICGSYSHSISRSPKLPLVFVFNLIETRYMFFYFLDVEGRTQTNKVSYTCQIQFLVTDLFVSDQLKKYKLSKLLQITDNYF